MRLKDKQSIERRKRILDTAERIIRKTQSTDFSIRYLAEAAGISPTTPYNIFGSKEGLLYALLDRSLDYITSKEGLQFRSKAPGLYIVDAATNAVEMFVADPHFLKPLYQVLLGVKDPLHRPIFMQRSLNYWRTVTDQLPDSPFLSNEQQRNMLAHAAETHFLGLLEYWVQDEVDDDGFRAHAVYGILLLIAGVVEGSLKTKVDALLRQTIRAFPDTALRTSTTLDFA